MIRKYVYNEKVFSTSVEVFLEQKRVAYRRFCLLHVRGGVSSSVCHGQQNSESSPRPWRCFQVRCLKFSLGLVFSTSVEVFPQAPRGQPQAIGLLHVRGGVSSHAQRRIHVQKSSPRPWRCFHSLERAK